MSPDFRRHGGIEGNWDMAAIPLKFVMSGSRNVLSARPVRGKDEIHGTKEDRTASMRFATTAKFAGNCLLLFTE